MTGTFGHVSEEPDEQTPPTRLISQGSLPRRLSRAIVWARQPAAEGDEGGKQDIRPLDRTDHGDLRNLRRRTRRTSPGVCPICTDERQYVPEDGQSGSPWTSWRRRASRHCSRRTSRGLSGSGPRPKVGIGQTAQLVVTPEGSLLWDPVGYVDGSAMRTVLERGPVLAIAASHPHMFGVQVEWSHQLGDVPVLVADAAGDGWGATIRSSNTGPAVKLSPKG